MQLTATMNIFLSKFCMIFFLVFAIVDDLFLQLRVKYFN